ncbi:hypothetical protein CEJ46_09240 [Vibrio anguillarum]|nr:hypothetical protein CEJ46_09240 [Vibrio anguillarum]
MIIQGEQHMKTVFKWASALVIFAVSTTPAFAITPLAQVQSDWAKCQYKMKSSDDQERCFERVIMRNTLEMQSSNNPELKVWLAINKSSLAGVKGGLGALSLVKEAKLLYEEVIDQAPNTLDGSAFTSLGTLYYKVPGWPVAFGDDVKAEELLQRALLINPTGIDANYFYGDFLAEQGRTDEARKYLLQAQQAPARPQRAIADAGRQQEIALLLENLK